MQKTSRPRDRGIDLLRVLAMGAIVLHHMFTHGGLLLAFPKGSPTRALLYLAEAFLCCAVNVYALISGWVRVRFRLSRLLCLWLQVLFYSVGLEILLLPLGAVPASEWAAAFAPVLSNRYWYVTAYFLLYLPLPLISRCMDRLTRPKALGVIVVCTPLFTVWPLLAGEDLFGLKGGYSPAWIVILYVLGGCARCLAQGRKPRRMRALVVFGLCALLSWGAWPAAQRGALPFAADALLQYVSPTILLCALMLLLAFRELPLPAWLSRCVSVLSPLTFGVYLIHDHPLVRRRLMYLRFDSFNRLPAPLLVLCVALSAVAIFAVCALIEYLRTRLFRVLRVEQGCAWVEKKARGLLTRLRAGR